jgi:hypothetical protein
MTVHLITRMWNASIRPQELHLATPPTRQTFSQQVGRTRVSQAATDNRDAAWQIQNTCERLCNVMGVYVRSSCIIHSEKSIADEVTTSWHGPGERA